MEAIYLTYAFREVSDESFNKEIAKIQFIKPKETRSCVRPVTIKVRDQETQALLSDEDREDLFAELPFHWVSSPESDAEVEVYLNPSLSFTYPVPSSCQAPPITLHSTE